MDCMVNGSDVPVPCHCPCTGEPRCFLLAKCMAVQLAEHACAGKIGGLRYREMANLQLPCLLTPSTSAGRSTQYTVEALSLDPADAPSHTYYGINQARANT